MRLLRLVVARRDPDSGVEQGVFTVVYELCETASVVADDRELLADNLSWFEKNLT